VISPGHNPWVVFPVLVPMHMGAMHPYEQVLMLVLAFGPFAVLGLVVVLRRRADDRAEAAQQVDPESDVASDVESDVRAQRER
jgi:hypothetical protein